MLTIQVTDLKQHTVSLTTCACTIKYLNLNNDYSHFIAQYVSTFALYV